MRNLRNIRNIVTINRIAALICPIVVMLFFNKCPNIMGVLGLVISATWMIFFGKKYDGFNKQ
ncbi:MAG: hypothetical protein AB6733_20790 [Clostridiaceae bacterium]